MREKVLVAWPRVCMNKAFQTKYDQVKWEYDDDLLEAWKQGRTGFPFIDAAMRQVQTTGPSPSLVSSSGGWG